MASLINIKSWFKNGLKPTEQQFFDTWDSFWHKENNIPVDKIEGIDNLLNLKADKSDVDNHLTDENAHATLFAKTRIIPYGKVLVFEQSGKTNPGVLAQGDYCILRIGDEIINANYLGGDILNRESYDI